MKTKKIVIIAGTMALLAGLFIYWKKKKAQTSSNAKTTTTTSGTTTATSTPTTTATTSVASTPTTSVVSTPTTTSTASTASAGASFANVVNISEKANLTGVAGLGVKAGDSVKVTSPLYNGTFKVWYVYQGNGNVQNIYIETPFKGNTSGTVSKA